MTSLVAVGKPDGRLVALIGQPRADLLHRLDEPAPAGLLASAMQYAPSVITHHVASLERSGLVRRERRGRQILVHRTGLGSALLRLYQATADP